MSLENRDQALRALAYVIAEIRPSWPKQLIEQALTATKRDLADVAADAIDAARNHDLKSPGAITTHRRNPERDITVHTPALFPRCDTCRQVTCVCDVGPPPMEFYRQTGLEPQETS